ncbi:MAG: dihydroxyacetone kinase subunit L [Erysipelotrichaceae bacterium]
MEKITRKDWELVFLEISELLISNKDYLTEIDAKYGDGDHGVTMEKIAHSLSTQASNWERGQEDLKSLFQVIGNSVTNVNGGSAGPLYGTYFEGLGECLEDGVMEVDAPLLKKILKSGLVELQYLSTAKVGDKTMMDTLIPATDAALNASDDIESIVTAAKDAAIAGAIKSKDFVSKFGRARSYKEQTIGTPDAGAQSCTYIFIGLYQALIK